MANICETELVIVGRKPAVQKIYETAKSIPTTPHSHGIFLGDLIEKLDPTKNENNNWGGIVCSGWINEYFKEVENPYHTEFEDPDNHDNDIVSIHMDYDSKWQACTDVHEFLETMFEHQDLCCYYRESEPGEGIFYTNSKEYFPEQYYMDTECDTSQYKDIFAVAKALIGFGYIDKFKNFDKETDYAAMAADKREKIELKLIKEVRKFIETYNKGNDDDWITLEEYELC